MLAMVDLSTAVSLYIIVSVIGIFILWFLWENIRLDRTSFGDEKRFFWECEICTFIYIDSINDEISICPRCGSYNKSKLKEVSKKKEIKKPEPVG